MMGILVSSAEAAAGTEASASARSTKKRELSTSRRLTQPSICARICLVGSNQKRTQPNKFYFILTVILSETIGGLNG
jgi:hypothetical protein